MAAGDAGLAAAGFHVVAPDQRGFGGTTGWDGDYDGDVGSFRLLNLVRDVMALLDRLGVRMVEAVVGHDFGASVAAWCALLRPDVFRRVALMSAPFPGPPRIGSGVRHGIDAGLADLARPRKHYHDYYSGREANGDMWRAPQGVKAFLRAYFHMKSADWAGNEPHPLSRWTGRGAGCDAGVLHHGPGERDGGDRGAAHAGRGGGLAVGCGAGGLCRGVRADGVSRGG